MPQNTFSSTCSHGVNTKSVFAYISMQFRSILTAFCCCWLTLLSLSTSAQPHVYPVVINPQMIVGGSVYIGDFANPMATAHKLNYTLTLKDPVELERTVYLRLSIVQNGTIIAVNPPSFRGREFTLYKDTPLNINGEDLADNLNIFNLDGLSGPNQYGVLNEGVTDICIEVIDAFRNEPISRKECATGYLARLQAPILILPIENQYLFENQLNNLVFTWQMTDPLAHLPGVDIQYQFELRERLPGLDPQDQFESNTLIYSTTIDQFSVFYNELSSPLMPGHSYIWRVTAIFYDQLGNSFPHYFVNHGRSRIGTLHVLPDININSEQSGVSCLCPIEECEIVIPTFTQAMRQLLPGDSIKFGAFFLNIRELEADGASGLGSIRIPFLNTAVDVGFENINVNDKFEVTQGQVKSLASQLLNGIGVDPDNLPDISELPINLPWLTEMNNHVNEFRESMSLPLSLGQKLALVGFDMPFDVFITDIEFSRTGAARMNLLVTIPGSNGQLYSFGATGINVGRNGFDMADLKLFLLHDMQLPGLAGVPLYVRKAVFDEPTQGSYINFGCTGFEQFNLQCSYTFPTHQLHHPDNPDEAVTATLTITSEQWGHFVGYGDMPAFAAKDAPGWVFSTDRLVVDLNQLTNPSEITFPDNYTTTEPTWQGFYVKNIHVTMPEDISMTQEGSTQFAANNVIIDRLGLTCQAEGRNVISVATDDAGGWSLSVDSISVEIYQNQFVDAFIQGLVGMDVLNAELNYAGLISKDEDQNYQFNLSPLGSFEIPYLLLKAEIEEGSVLAIEKHPVTHAYTPYVDLNVGVQLMVEEQDFRSTGLDDVIDQLKILLRSDTFDLGLTGLHFKNFRVNHPDLPAGKKFGLGSTEGGTIKIPGVSDMTLSEFMLLDKEQVFDAMTLPAIGVDVQMNLGPLNVGLGVWAKQDTTGKGGYTFGKFELTYPDFSGVSFSCHCDGDTTAVVNYCEPPSLIGGTPTTVAIGDEVMVGHFNMIIDTLSGPTSGTGKLQIPFLGIKMAVDFENLTFHTMPDGKKRLISGQVRTTPNALLGDYEVAVSDVEGPLNLADLSVTQDFISELNNMANDIGGFFTLPMSLSQKMESLFGVSLPEGFDFILLGIQFDGQGARLSAMLTMQFPGDNYMKFGLSGLNFRPDGFNLDGIQIFLAEDFTLGY